MEKGKERRRERRKEGKERERREGTEGGRQTGRKGKKSFYSLLSRFLCLAQITSVRREKGCVVWKKKITHGVQKHAVYSLYCLTFIALDRNFFPESRVLPRRGFAFVSFLTQNMASVYISNSKALTPCRKEMLI